ncbi:amino acid permease-domain-containing protein [Microdochium trichocladiopsis]|uniref:Amino acid permease-domain-containing protein n=1 Tax=Microdochium trichocladiopsis TaxID=1682393 RepID=A0A9P8XST9_9PEZI|nr:amino acid permease-domain-containing protein [Microdochium trichocladiopsis]KAH7014606.1 amino acid permease-domain-containing protein [Microdochium trichocladiopsis]
MPAFTLYGARGSSNTDRVRLTLAEGGFTDYDLVLLDLAKGEQKSPDNMARHPWGKVPSVVFPDGFTLFESRAICKHLAQRYSFPLLPAASDHKNTALFEQALCIESSYFAEPAGKIGFEKFAKKFMGLPADEAVVAQSVQALETFFDVAERILQHSDHYYLNADMEKATGDGVSRNVNDSIETLEGGVEGLVVDKYRPKHDINSRQAQMMAIGGVIGTGLFVGTGSILAVAGPALLVSAFVVVCFICFCVVTATTEFNAYLPVRGASVPYYGTRFVSKSLGFAMGWLYCYIWAIAVAYEITAAAIVINYWPNTVPTAVWITIMLVVIVALNFLPVKYYAESDFWFASIKVFAILGLLVLSVVLFFGGGPDRQPLYFRYWGQEPAHEYLVEGKAGQVCAFIFAFCNAAFSFLFGPEFVVSASGEMKNPRKDLPTTTKHFAWRLITFYGLGAIAISIICDSRDPALTSHGVGAAASPWVLGIKNAGIRGLDSVINAAIITSAWSSGNALLFMSSRALYSMALVGQAPALFTRCNRWGVPYYAVAAPSLVGLLAYMNVSNSSSVVFMWLVSFMNMAGYISWICCCVVYIRFRKACDAQGVHSSSLPYRSVLQPYGAWFALAMVVIMALLNGFNNFFPGGFTTAGFLTSYLCLPIFFLLYFGHKATVWGEAWLISPQDVDLHTGLEELDALDNARVEDGDKVGGKRSRLRTVTDKISTVWGWR